MFLTLTFEEIRHGEKQTAIENNKYILGPQMYSCDQNQVKCQWNNDKKVTCKS